MERTKTAIIFGVNGQDGSYLAEHLLNEGYRVIGTIRRSSVDTTERLRGPKNNDKFKLVECDVADYISVSGVFRSANEFLGTEQPAEVYNLAAQSHVGTSFSQPIATWRINAEGPLNILEVIRREGWPGYTRFYQASTSEMFGNNVSLDHTELGTRVSDVKHLNELERQCCYQNESTTFSPQSPYAIAKVAAHETAKLYRQMYGMHASCGILFNHESPRRGENFVTRKITKYVGELLRAIKPHIPFIAGKRRDMVMLDEYIGVDEFNKQNIILIDDNDVMPYPKLKLGNLNARRDWGYAPDYVKAMYLMLQQETPDDYVVATGETHSVADFCEAAFACIGIKDWYKCVYIDEDCKRPADVQHLRGRARMAHLILGWEPQTTFTELVRLMVEADSDGLHNN